MEELANNDVVPNDEPQQNPVVDNEPNMNLLGDHSMKKDQPSLMIIWYIYIYIYEDTNDIVIETNPTSFKEAIKSWHSFNWLDAMKDEMKSMSTNNIWGLVEIPKEAKAIGCKWVYKTKHDSKGNIKRFKARLVAKDFTQREEIDYTGIFSPMSSKDSFIIIMALVAQYDLELHQIVVKTAFLKTCKKM
jgi:hypothetical protein